MSYNAQLRAQDTKENANCKYRSWFCSNGRHWFPTCRLHLTKRFTIDDLVVHAKELNVQLELNRKYKSSAFLQSFYSL